MLVAALLWYKTLKKDLEEIGFEFNPYDPCVCNRTVKKQQQTVRFHVDDLMSSHVDKSVNDKILQMVKRKVWWTWGSQSDERKIPRLSWYGIRLQ